MLVKYLFLYSFFYFVQGVVYYNVSSDTVFSLQCTYENNCEEDMIIQGDSGYKLLITMKSLDIYGENGDFLLVKSGDTLDDGLTGRIFTHHINGEKQYISLTENVFLRFNINQFSVTNHTGFILTAEYYGEQVTTPVPTTTDVPWPTTSEEETPYITVNMRISQYNNNTISYFVERVVDMATQYVATNTDFTLAQPISTNNIQINKIIQCPLYWPDRDTCFQITFAVPLLLLEDSEHYGTYQLNETHLEDMWKGNAATYFDDLNYSPYKERNNNRVMIIWLTIICSTSLIFGIVYLVAGYGCSGFIARKKKRQMEQQNQHLSEDTIRSSVASLTPHPLQSVPPWFESDMTYYDPDSSPSYFRSSGLDTPVDGVLQTENLGKFVFDGKNLVEDTET